MNQEMYAHRNSLEARTWFTNTYGHKNNYALNTTSYLYAPNFTDKPLVQIEELGSNGVNPFNQRPVINMLGASGAVYHVHLCAIYDSVINIQSDGRVKRVITWDPSTKMPVAKAQRTIAETGSSQ